MDEQPRDKNLSDFLEYQLPIFDEILAKEHTPLRQRPLAATMDFVTYCVVEIEGDSKENALEKSWFKFLYQQVAEWYSQRYGDAMKADTKWSALGLILIYGTPFRIEIPLSVAGKVESPTKRWFCLPNEVLEEENVFDWVVNPPNFKKMSAAELSWVETDLRVIANSIRSLKINLMTAIKEGEGLRISAGSIPSHIEKSANDILSLSRGGISSSVWELHLAMEKSLKLLIRQKGCDPPNIHDLVELCNKANQMDGVSIDMGALRNLPSHHDAIRHRYGEADALTVDQAVLNYKSSLTIVREITAVLSRKIVMKNAKLLIQKPPWVA